MADRWAAAVRLTVLLSGTMPAAVLAQSPPARTNPLRDKFFTPASATAGQSSKDSSLLRFASADDEDEDSVLSAKPLSAKSSLQPLGPNWLKDTTPELFAPPKSASPVDDLLPDSIEPDLLSAPDGPSFAAPPETLGPDALSPGGMPELLGADPLSPGSLPDTLSPSGGLLHDLPSGWAPPAIRQPMLRESWLYRPFNLSIFEGALFATSPVPAQFNTTVSYFTGFRVGWDYAAHFGGETRFGFSKVFLLDSHTRSTQVGFQRLFYFDSSVLIYPWGDTRWRPFLAIGGGLADIFIISNSGVNLHPGAFNLPFGGGIKYRRGTRLAFRADIRDNLTFSGGGGLATLNNIEIVGGVEFHFGGGDRRTYWPWNPSRHWW